MSSAPQTVPPLPASRKRKGFIIGGVGLLVTLIVILAYLRYDA